MSPPSDKTGHNEQSLLVQARSSLPAEPILDIDEFTSDHKNSRGSNIDPRPLCGLD